MPTNLTTFQALHHQVQAEKEIINKINDQIGTKI